MPTRSPVEAGPPAIPDRSGERSIPSAPRTPVSRWPSWPTVIWIPGPMCGSTSRLWSTSGPTRRISSSTLGKPRWREGRAAQWASGFHAAVVVADAQAVLPESGAGRPVLRQSHRPGRRRPVAGLLRLGVGKRPVRGAGSLLVHPLAPEGRSLGDDFGRGAVPMVGLGAGGPCPTGLGRCSGGSVARGGLPIA